MSENISSTNSPLSEIEAMRMIKEDRIASSKLRMEESISLLEKSTGVIRDQVNNKVESAVKKKKDEILQKILRSYADISRIYGKEISQYISTAPEEKQDIFKFLQTAVPKQPKKRSQRQASSVNDNQQAAFFEDFDFIMNDRKNDGDDLASQVILTDGCFLYNGICYAVGDSVGIVRTSNLIIQAKIELVTKAEITFSFADGSIMRITKEDLETHKISFN